ncbi:MAG: glycosyltransferase [Verrucomicrobiia bacterium]
MAAPIPKVSIGLPVYNGENYLRAALDSILRQDYADFELIISDNASTDATQDICLEYAAKDQRIRYYRNETNIGASGNFNCLVELARGKFFKWAAHDDVHSPEFLRRCVDVIEQAPLTVALVTPRTEVIDEFGKIVNVPVESLDTRHPRPHQRLKDVLRTVRWATALFGLFRTDTLRKTRLIQPFFAADNVLLVEVALMGEIRELPEKLFQRRVHPGTSIVANKNWRKLQVWFDPSQKGLRSFVPPAPRLGMEIVFAIMRAQLPLRERFLCCLTFVMVWLPRECRRLFMMFRNKIAFRTRLRKCFDGVPRESL